jgi:hypothetical protein
MQTHEYMLLFIRKDVYCKKRPGHSVRTQANEINSAAQSGAPGKYDGEKFYVNTKLKNLLKSRHGYAEKLKLADDNLLKDITITTNQY